MCSLAMLTQLMGPFPYQVTCFAPRPIFACHDKTGQSFYRQKNGTSKLTSAVTLAVVLPDQGLKAQQLLLIFNSFPLSPF